MTLDEIMEEYFNWLYELVCPHDATGITWVKLFKKLHGTRFTYSIERDGNRAADGLSLRNRFAYSRDYSNEIDDCLLGPCSVLEMMVSLAVRCETEIMDNPKYGNRTSQWFWGMISSLGLSGMYDDNYNAEEVDFIIKRFLDRKYSYNGEGGLFTVRNCTTDLRDEEIWVQMNWYLAALF